MNTKSETFQLPVDDRYNEGIRFIASMRGIFCLLSFFRVRDREFNA